MRGNLDADPTITPTLEGKFVPLHHWRLHLVPGGRFLAVLNLPSHASSHTVETTTLVLSIYDLGEPGATTNHHVRSVVVSQSFDIACSVQGMTTWAESGVVIVGGSSFRVAVVHPMAYAMEPAPQWRAIAFDVEFGAEDGSNPSLKRHQSSITIDMLQSGGLVLNICLQRHLVLLRFSDWVVLWDAERMAYTSIRVVGLGRCQGIEPLSLLTSHHLVCIGAGTLVVRDLSLLGWIGGGPSLHIKEASSKVVPPDMVISNPWNREALDRIAFSQVPCPAVPDNRVYFDVHYYTDTIARYQLDVTPHSLGSLVRPPTAIAEPELGLSLSLISVTRFPASRFSTKSDLALGQLCFTWGWGGVPGVMLYAYAPGDSPTIPSMTPETLVEETALTTYVHLGAHFPHSFCALSGRMICTQERRSVKVVDYLA